MLCVHRILICYALVIIPLLLSLANLHSTAYIWDDGSSLDEYSMDMANIHSNATAPQVVQLNHLRTNQKNTPAEEDTPVLLLVQRTEETDVVEDAGWWTPYADNISRTYIPWNKNGTKEWCLPETDDPSQESEMVVPDDAPVEGLLFIKSHKASSSTGEGINEAIAHHVGKRLSSSTSTSSTSTSSNTSSHTCRHYNRHEFANRKQHGRRDHASSLLWTFVRDPKRRDVSQVFHFRVSRQGIAPSNVPVLKEALGRQRSSQTRYLLPNWDNEWKLSPGRVQREPQQVATLIHELLNDYNFIGITERIHESLAVMTLLWDLEVTDVIVLNAKQAGGYDGGGKRQKCTKIQKTPAVLEPALQAYLDDSPDYQTGHADFLLYHAANRSLDHTIALLGHNTVAQRARTIQQLQAVAEATCRPAAIFPCSEDGTYQLEASKDNCYVQDSGCGYPCVDQLMEDYHRNGTVLMLLPAFLDGGDTTKPASTTTRTK